MSYLKVLGVNLHDEVLRYLRKKSGSLKLDDLVKHMQEICGLARNLESLIPRALVIILLLALSVQYAAAVGREPLFFLVSMSNEARVEKKVQIEQQILTVAVPWVLALVEITSFFFY